MAFDTTVHLGDLINIGVGIIVSFIGWAVRKLFHAAMEVIDDIREIQPLADRHERTAEVVDIHSTILLKHKLSAQPLPTVARQRRQADRGVVVEP